MPNLDRPSTAMNAQLPANLLPEVAAFLGQSPLPGVIGGQDVMAANGEMFCTRDPGSGQPLAEVAAMQPDDVDRAVRAAQRAFDTTGWPRLQPNERGVLLHRLADLVERRKSVLAQIEALDTGKILAQAEWDVQNLIDTLRYYTDLAIHVSGVQVSSGFSRHPAPPEGGTTNRPPEGGTTTVPFSAQQRSPLAIAGHEAWTGPLAVGAVRVHLPLELPAAAGGLEHLARPGRRQHRGHQAGRGHAALDALLGPAGPRGRHPRRRDQRRARLRQPDRRGAGLASGPPAAVVHRLARGRPA